MKAFLFRLFALALIALCLPAPVRAAEPYEINAIFEQTGQFAFLGTKQTAALRVFEDMVNAQGGVRGRPLKFIFHDDQSNPQVAVQIVSQLVAQKVPVIIGPSLAAVCTAVFPLVEKNGPVLWCPSPVVRPEPGGYAFMYAPGVADLQPLTIRYYYGRGMRNFALITTTDTSGQIYDDSFEGTLNRPEFKGAKLVAHERHNVTDISVAAQMARIKAAKPDVIITFSGGPPFATELRAINDAGIDVPVYGAGGNLNVDQLSQLDSIMPKELVLNAAEGFLPDPEAPAPIKRRQTSFFDTMKKAGLHVEYAHSIMWDPCTLIVEAIRTLGTGATASLIHEYIEHQRNWAGIQGFYNFTTGDQKGLGEAGAALVRWNQKQRIFELVASGARGH